MRGTINVRSCSVGSELSNENVSACWKSWSACTTGSMWTPSQRTRTAPEAAGASWTNTNTLPPMSSATLCTEACHGGHALHSLVPLVYGPKWWDKCAHVASRVKRSCASNRIRVSLHCCPQTSCVGWEYLLYSIGLYRCARVCVKKRLAF